MEHSRQHRLDGVKGPVHIDGEDPAPEGVRHVLEQVLLRDAGVVDQQGDGPAQSVLRGTDGGGDGGTVRHVGLEGRRLPALGPKLLRQLLRQGL